VSEATAECVQAHGPYTKCVMLVCDGCATRINAHEAALELAEVVLALGPDETPSLALTLNWQHLAREFVWPQYEVSAQVEHHNI